MSFRQFAFGLTASFGIAWLAIVIVPFFIMRQVKPVAFDETADGQEGIYHPQRAGRVVNGAEVYAANGCYHCHSQLIRPTYAGNDLGRPDWAGLKADEERGDTRRESNVFDYQGEKFAQIGLSRLGPDLSNVGRRVEKLYVGEGGDANTSTIRVRIRSGRPPSVPPSASSLTPSRSKARRRTPPWRSPRMVRLSCRATRRSPWSITFSR
jgi:hypothetical protein